MTDPSGCRWLAEHIHGQGAAPRSARSGPSAVRALESTSQLVIACTAAGLCELSGLAKKSSSMC